jgi:hypothetical protein
MCTLHSARYCGCFFFSRPWAKGCGQAHINLTHFSRWRFCVHTRTHAHSHARTSQVSTATARVTVASERLALVLLLDVAPHAVANAVVLARRAHAALRRALSTPDNTRGDHATGASSSLSSAASAHTRDGGDSSIDDAAVTTATVARLRAALIAAWPFVSRAHLASFYFTGRFLTLAHRLVGVRHVVLSDAARSADPPQYSVLGAMILAQLAVELGTRAAREVSRRAGGRGAEMSGTGAIGRGVGNGSAGADGSDRGGGDGAGASDDNVGGTDEVPLLLRGVDASKDGDLGNCPLCLGPREVPTATPCGHVLCWDCVSEWCATNPECPVCRQSALPSKLLRLHNFATES